MLKKIMVSLLSLSASLSVACPASSPTSSPDFCASFRYAARCHCVALGVPARLCGDVNNIYRMMVARYHSVDRACASQHDTSMQSCMDDWGCFLAGGRNSQNELCSGTGAAC